jgi:hypothetical protein
MSRQFGPTCLSRVIAFLASDATSAVTGAAIPVDCGLTAGNLVMARELTLQDQSRTGQCPKTTLETIA